MPYSRISQIKKVFNLANATQRSYGGCSSAVEVPLFNLHDVIHEYVIFLKLNVKFD